MAMVLIPRIRVVARVMVAACGWMVVAQAMAGQPPVHFSRQSSLPTGAIGRAQLERGGPLGGYFQPVEILAPEGVTISPAVDGAFESPSPAPFLAGMLIGEVYRLRVTGIVTHEGEEIFP